MHERFYTVRLIATCYVTFNCHQTPRVKNINTPTIYHVYTHHTHSHADTHKRKMRTLLLNENIKKRHIVGHIRDVLYRKVHQ